jgi:NADPH:quinone reductase-like Zn-dependent oxidoreductase
VGDPLQLAMLGINPVTQVADGTLSAPVEATYPLQEYRAAIGHAARGGRNGKVLFSFEH